MALTSTSSSVKGEVSGVITKAIYASIGLAPARRIGTAVIANVTRMAITTRTGVDQYRDPHQAALPRPAMSMPSCSGSASRVPISPTTRPSYSTTSRSDRASSSSRSSDTRSDRGPLRAAGEQLRTHVLGGPDVESARWLRDDEQARISRENASQQDLLDVAAGQGRHGVIRPGTDVEAIDQVEGVLRRCGARRCARHAGSRRDAPGRGCRPPTGHRSGSHAGPPGCARRAARIIRVGSAPPARRRPRRSIHGSVRACRKAARRARSGHCPTRRRSPGSRHRRPPA